MNRRVRSCIHTFPCAQRVDADLGGGPVKPRIARLAKRFGQFGIGMLSVSPHALLSRAGARA